MINLPGNEFVLVQAFPRSVTENMLANANRTGIFLEVMLIGSFVIYIIALMVRTRREKKLLARGKSGNELCDRGNQHPVLPVCYD